MRFTCGSLLVNPGAQINFQGKNGIVNAELKILGNESNQANIFNGSINFSGIEDVIVKYCNFSQVHLNIASNVSLPNYILVNNCIFNNTSTAPFAINSGNNILINNCNLTNTPISIAKSDFSGNVELKNLILESIFQKRDWLI